MRQIVLQGNSIERGRRYGKAFSEEIHRAVFQLRGSGLGTCSINGFPRGVVKSLVRTFQLSLNQRLPYVLEEIKGIAEGAQMALDDALLLNMAPTFGDGRKACSQVGFKGTTLGRMHVKTSDMGPREKELYLLRKVIPEEGYSMITVGWIGGLWAEAGMNERGLTIGISSIGGISSECSSVGTDRYLLTYPILMHCASVREAATFCGEWSLLKRGVLFMMTDSQGNLAVLEKSPNHQAVRWAKGNVIFCTNRYELPPMKPLVIPPQQYLDNAARRAGTLQHLLAGPLYTVNELTLEHVIQHLLSDHSPTGPICQHGIDNMYSLHSYIFLPDLRKLFLSNGYACHGNFSEVTLPDSRNLEPSTSPANQISEADVDEG